MTIFLCTVPKSTKTTIEIDGALSGIWNIQPIKFMVYLFHRCVACSFNVATTIFANNVHYILPITLLSSDR